MVLEPPPLARRADLLAMAWVLLTIAGLLEIVWAAALKQAAGFSRFWPSVLAISTATASFCLLAMALRTLPVGAGYAVWVGIGVLGTTAFGITFLGEPASWSRAAFLLAILVGVVGLMLTES
jgi:quaternary ammonium compound-resistance protein SugE